MVKRKRPTDAMFMMTRVWSTGMQPLSRRLLLRRFIWALWVLSVTLILPKSRCRRLLWDLWRTTLRSNLVYLLIPSVFPKIDKISRTVLVHSTKNPDHKLKPFQQCSIQSSAVISRSIILLLKILINMNGHTSDSDSCKKLKPVIKQMHQSWKLSEHRGVIRNKTVSIFLTWTCFSLLSSFRKRTHIST